MCILIILHSSIVIIYNRYTTGKWEFTLKTRWRLKIAQRKHSATSSILCKHVIVWSEYNDQIRISYTVCFIRFFICFTLFIYLALSKTINLKFYFFHNNFQSKFFVFIISNGWLERLSAYMSDQHSCFTDIQPHGKCSLMFKY